MHATLNHLFRYVNLRLASTPPLPLPNGPGPPMQNATMRKVIVKARNLQLTECNLTRIFIAPLLSLI